MNLKASDASGRSSRNEKWRTDAGAVEIVGAPAIRVNPARTRRDAIGRKPLFAAFAVRYAVVTPWSPPGHIVAPAERKHRAHEPARHRSCTRAAPDEPRTSLDLLRMPEADPPLGGAHAAARRHRRAPALRHLPDPEPRLLGLTPRLPSLRGTRSRTILCVSEVGSGACASPRRSPQPESRQHPPKGHSG